MSQNSILHDNMLLFSKGPNKCLATHKLKAMDPTNY